MVLVAVAVAGRAAGKLQSAVARSPVGCPWSCSVSVPSLKLDTKFRHPGNPGRERDNVFVGHGNHSDPGLRRGFCGASYMNADCRWPFSSPAETRARRIAQVNSGRPGSHKHRRRFGQGELLVLRGQPFLCRSPAHTRPTLPVRLTPEQHA